MCQLYRRAGRALPAAGSIAWGYPSPAPCESPLRQPRSRPPLPAPATPSDGWPRHRLQCCTRPRDPSSAKARRQSTAKPETGFVRIEKVGFAMDSPLEPGGFELPVPSRTAVACPPISLDSSSTKTTSGVRLRERASGFSARDPFRAREREPVSPTQGDVDQRRKTNRSVSQFTQTPPKSAANCSFTPSGPANGVRNQRPKGTVHG